jgi:hypothetical protein
MYYCDLNPRYGVRYEKRGAIFLRYEGGKANRAALQCATGKAADANAAKLNAQEADPLYPARPAGEDVVRPGEIEIT